MSRNAIIAAAVKSLVIGATLAIAVTPAISVAQAPDPAVALAASLAATATSSEAAAKAKKLSPVDTQKAIEAALEQTIAVSGLEPTVAIAALLATQTNMEKAGTMTPPIAAAIAAILAKIQAALKLQEVPGSTGRAGATALGAPPPSGGGGGSDYRPAS